MRLESEARREGKGGMAGVGRRKGAQVSINRLVGAEEEEMAPIKYIGFTTLTFQGHVMSPGM